jgi:hypothetical protein
MKRQNPKQSQTTLTSMYGAVFAIAAFSNAGVQRGVSGYVM